METIASRIIASLCVVLVLPQLSFAQTLSVSDFIPPNRDLPIPEQISLTGDSDNYKAVCRELWHSQTEKDKTRTHGFQSADSLRFGFESSGGGICSAPSEKAPILGGYFVNYITLERTPNNNDKAFISHMIMSKFIPDEVPLDEVATAFLAKYGSTGAVHCSDPFFGKYGTCEHEYVRRWESGWHIQYRIIQHGLYLSVSVTGKQRDDGLRTIVLEINNFTYSVAASSERNADEFLEGL